MIRLSVRSISIVILSIALFQNVYANEVVTFESGKKQVSILEVYSSQGCSSCPPAEKWVNTWLNNSDLWTRFIPMIFHVDYWDYLGWPDPFADSQFSFRQSQFKQQGLSNAVYTPGFMLNGREWRGWFRGKKPAKQQSEAGNLKVQLDGTDISASFEQAAETDRLNLAVLGFGLRTYVQRGENRRKTLAQEFVVLSHKQVDNLGDVWLSDLDKPKVAAQKYALVAWVTPKDSLEPKQAVGGFLPNNTFKF